ncbi:MAG TPA: sigma 54-interacting transcriptional regulator [Gemmataceae bacterium]|nr:sigma 54-interacting transcriptional regulator [Gemmataceae bacterium]
MNNETSVAGPCIQDPPGASPPAAGGNGSPATADHDDLDILRAIVEGTAGSTGEEFFQDLVRHLTSALGVPFAAISEFPGVSARVRTLAFWARGRMQENFEYDLAGTPCEEVTRGRLCHYPSGVKDRFPRASPLVRLGVESYLGAPLLDSKGKVLGLLAVFDDGPMPAHPRHLYLLRIFAARVAAVMERLRAERQVSASEQRYRDLYEEAPVGYLSVGADGRILSANRRASQMVGFSAEQLEGLSVADLVGGAPAGKARYAESFQRLLAGQESSGLEVEMRRKDGRPLWISLWMKPIRGADGKVHASRSVWVDVTDRVLAEAEQARLQQQNLYLEAELKAAHNFEELIGQGPALQAVLDKVRSVAPTDASVLITGETGTGKELIARAIHSASKRRDKPLIKINCAAFPPGLVESELFGHEKGAFTGAIARRGGRFELANEGTIFLDEIGEVPPETQVKLLRVLQEREFDRVGGSSPIKVDIRVLAATNRDLLQAVYEKTFREDLYYRLNVFPIALPPLRERKEDIPLLVHFLVNKFATRIGKRIDGVTDHTMRRLIDYPWPGNVRELENVLERAVILATGATLGVVPDLVPLSDAAPAATPSRPQLTLESVDRDHIVAVLQQTDGVVDGPRGAARILGLHPNTLRNRMKKLGVSRASHQIR